MPRQRIPTVALVSLGCPKNLVDSERMLATLALDGFAVTPDPDGADVAVVNTCAFIDLARAESDQHVAALEALKQAGRLGRLVVAGCLAQRQGEDVLRRHPLVDAVVGVADRDSLARVCRQALAGRPRRRPAVCVGPHAAAAPDDRVRLRLTPRHYAYLRLSEGCDNRCAYCAIPDIRGPLRSKAPGAVLAEARELAADGTREIVLIGQDTTSYGRDGAAARATAGRAAPRSRRTLARLLARLRRGVRVPWLRLMYTHPASFGDDVIEQLAAGPPLVPYVDLPIQHAADRVLASMGRRVTRADIEGLVARLREAVPGITLRTSFIVGYPGETKAEFETLLAMVRELRFDHVGVFVYSAEPGTRAAALPGQVPEAEKRRRWHRLMAVAERLAHRAARRRVGEVLTVLVDGSQEGGRLAARHAGQAPEVDSVVLLAPGAAERGRFVRVRVTGAEGYDLVGEVVAE